jgi:hypothetical protein
VTHRAINEKMPGTVTGQTVQPNRVKLHLNNVHAVHAFIRNHFRRNEFDV